MTQLKPRRGVAGAGKSGEAGPAKAKPANRPAAAHTSKGKDEVGNQTAAETNIDMQVMWDAGPNIGLSKNTFKLGLEYQYWKNKFGNSASIAGPGSFAKTPMIRAEYHF